VQASVFTARRGRGQRSKVELQAKLTGVVCLGFFIALGNLAAQFWGKEHSSAGGV
jgi:hypothetical protein